MEKKFSDKVIVVNGGLRGNNEIINFYDYYDIKEKDIVFIDDSYYLGRTRDKIKYMIQKHGGNLLCTYVFYDGSRVKDDLVHSFYRYYDNYN